MGTPRNLHVLLLTDAKKRLNCTDSPWAHRESYMCCCSPMQRSVSTGPIHTRHTAKVTCVAARRCKEPSRLYGLTIGTPARQRLSKTHFSGFAGDNNKRQRLLQAGVLPSTQETPVQMKGGLFLPLVNLVKYCRPFLQAERDSVTNIPNKPSKAKPGVEPKP